MKQALHISVNGAVRVIDLDDGDTLTIMQQAVGGLIEAVNLSPKCTLWCNEEGKLNGLPVNILASYIWHKALWPRVEEKDVVVGDVIITGGTDQHGEILPFDFDEMRTKFDVEVNFENV